MFISLRKLVINTAHIETIESKSTFTNEGEILHISMTSGLEIDLSKSDGMELMAYMGKHHMIHRSHE